MSTVTAALSSSESFLARPPSRELVTVVHLTVAYLDALAVNAVSLRRAGLLLVSGTSGSGPIDEVGSAVEDPTVSAFRECGPLLRAAPRSELGVVHPERLGGLAGGHELLRHQTILP